MPKSSLESLYAQVAKKVLTESLSVKKGQSVTVESWNNGLPFARHVVVEARRLGAIPLVVLEDEDAYIEGAKVMPKDALGQMGKQEVALISQTDAYVFIPGPVLGAYSHKMDRATYLDSIRYNQAWYAAASKAKLRGVRLTYGHIGDEATDVLGKPVQSVISHQLQAALADYKSIGRRGREIASDLVEGADVIVAGHGSKLQLTIKGAVEVEDGIVDDADVASESNVTYIPPGFVYAEVAPESVSGVYRFSPTVTRFGMVSDGTAEFEKGELVGIKSPGSKSALEKALDAAASKTAASITIGLNPLLKYGYGRNVCSEGVVGVRMLGMDFTSMSASVSVKGKRLLGP